MSGVEHLTAGSLRIPRSFPSCLTEGAPGRGIRLFRVGPIAVVADASWFLGLALIAAWFAFASRPDGEAPSVPQGLIGLAAGLALFASILVHELAHCALSHRFGRPVHRIRLFLLGGVSEVSEEPDRPGREFLVAAAGPASSLFLGLSCLLVGWALAPDSPGITGRPYAPALLGELGRVNVGLGLFNLLPAFPLDGGRCLRAILAWRTRDFLAATRRACRIGRLVGAFLVGAALWLAWIGEWFGGFWVIALGIFLYGAARASEETVSTPPGPDSRGLPREGIESDHARSTAGSPRSPMPRQIAARQLRSGDAVSQMPKPQLTGISAPVTDRASSESR